jgi:purine-binding chemotaxis protein CheW
MEKKSGTLNSIQIVCFKIGREEYGLEILAVQEILKLPKVTRLPKSADFIMGVINLRGKVIPIVDLSRRFNIEGTESLPDRRAIVVEIRGKKVGLAIDSVSHVIKVDEKDIEPPPPIVKGISSRYITGIVKLKEGFVIMLDIKQIFSAEEISLL